MPESISDKAKIIEARSFSSAAAFALVDKLIAFPTEVNGLTIVDIGAGASSATLELRKRRAVAYAVDPGYRNVQKLIKSAERNALTEGSATLNAISSGAYQVLGHSQEELLAVAREGLVSSRREKGKALADFIADFRRNRDRYKATWAHALPFETGSVDIVFSVQSMSKFLILDKDLFAASVEEALRVLKSSQNTPNSGQLILQPWPVISGSGSLVEKQNGHSFLQRLGQSNIRFSLEDGPEGASPRLKVFKP